MRRTNYVRGLAAATLITAGLAGVQTASASQRPLSVRVTSATPGTQLWSAAVAGGTAEAETASPDGKTVFVTGLVQRSGSFKELFETVAYDAVTGGRLWAAAYQPAGNSISTAIAVSPGGATVYVTGNNSSTAGTSVATVAYAAGTGRQLWTSRPKPTSIARVSALAVSPDGSTLYVAGESRPSGGQTDLAVGAYAAATGKQRWARIYTKIKSAGTRSVVVSPDGKSVYAAGSGGSSALTVAYQANGTLKWAAQFKNPFPGLSGATQIVAGPGGSAVYVVGTAANKAGHFDLATFAYRAATGRQLWLERDSVDAGGCLCQPNLAVAPGGRTLIVVGPRNGGRTGGYAITSYNASTGQTQWTKQAPAAADAPEAPAGLVINPAGDTAFVASSQFGGGYALAAWSVADGTVLRTSTYAGAKVYGPVAIALSGDGSEVFETGEASVPDGHMTTVAFRA